MFLCLKNELKEKQERL